MAIMISAKKKKRAGLCAIAIIVLVICAVVKIKQSELDHEYQTELNSYEQMQKDYADEELRASVLNREIDYRKTDNYIEDVARKVLGLAYEDEIIFESSDDE